MFKENQKAKSLSLVTDHLAIQNHEQTSKGLSEVVKFLWIFLINRKKLQIHKQMKDKAQVIANILHPDKISLRAILSEDGVVPKLNNHMKCDWQIVSYNFIQTSIPKAVFLI